jgi:hypothetical protein
MTYGVAANFFLAEGAIARRISAAISPCERNALSEKKPRNLQAVAILADSGVGSAVKAHCGDFPASPPWIQPK